MKDRSYHESAILYNEGLALKAEEQSASVTHPIPKKWNDAVGKQHRFHEKRHRAALEKLLRRESDELSDDVTEKTELAGPSEPELNDGKGI